MRIPTALAITTAALLAAAAPAWGASPWSSAPGNGGTPDIAVGASGTAHIVWEDSAPAIDQVRYCQLPRGGGCVNPKTFVGTQRMDDDGASGRPHVFVSSPNAVTVFHQRGLNGSPLDDTAAMFHAQILSSDSGEDAAIGLHLADGSRPVAVYEIQSSPPQLAWRKLSGPVTEANINDEAQWGAQEVISTDIGAADGPALAAGPSGLFLFWQRTLPDRSYVMRFTGGGWSAPVPISDCKAWKSIGSIREAGDPRPQHVRLQRADRRAPAQAGLLPRAAEDRRPCGQPVAGGDDQVQGDQAQEAAQLIGAPHWGHRN